MARTFPPLWPHWIKTCSAPLRKLWKASTSILHCTPPSSDSLGPQFKGNLQRPLMLRGGASAESHRLPTRRRGHGTSALHGAMLLRNRPARVAPPVSLLFSVRAPRSLWDSVAFPQATEPPLRHRRTPGSYPQRSTARSADCMFLPQRIRGANLRDLPPIPKIGFPSRATATCVGARHRRS